MCTFGPGLLIGGGHDSGQASSPLSAIPTSYPCTSVEEEAYLGIQTSSSFRSSIYTVGTSHRSCRVTTDSPPVPLLLPKRFGPWVFYLVGTRTHFFRTPLLGYVESSVIRAWMACEYNQLKDQSHHDKSAYPLPLLVPLVLISQKKTSCMCPSNAAENITPSTPPPPQTPQPSPSPPHPPPPPHPPLPPPPQPPPPQPRPP